MARTFSLPAKLTRPSARGLIARPRLLKLLDRRARNARAVWLNAPGGSGKTSLISSWIKARRLKCLWYELDAGDADPATFFHYLGEVAKAAPRKRKQPLSHFTPEYVFGLEVFVRRFFEDLFSRYPVPFVLVLDNYQETPADAKLHAIMSIALAAVPRGCRIVFLSRGDAPAAFARWQVERQLASLSWDEIRLTDREARALSKVMPYDVPRNIAALNELARGWVAGLILLLRARAEGVATSERRDESARPVFDYFAAEVFAKIPLATRVFLMRTACLPHVTPVLAAGVTGRENATELLTELYRNRLFIDRRAGGDVVYEYHPLFREFLLARAAEQFNAEELAALARAAGRALESTGQTEAALELYAQAADWGETTRLILVQAPALMAQGRWQALLQWIACLPETMLDEEPWLRFWLGICRLTSGPPAGRSELEIAYAGFEADSNKAGQALAASALIESYGTQFVDVERADYWIDALNALVRGGVVLPPDLEVRVRINLLVGLIGRRPGDPHLQRMDEWLEQFLEAQISLVLKMQLFISVFPYAYWHADAAQARRMADLVARFSALAEATPLSRLFGAMCLLFHASTMGDFPAASDLYTRAIKVAHDFGLDFAVPMLRSFYAHAALACGETETARQMIDADAAAHAPAGDVTSYGQFQILKAWLAAYDGNRNAAAAAARAYRERVYDTGMLHGPMQARGCAMLAQALVHVGAIGEACEMLACARKEATTYTNQFPLIDAEFHFVEVACALDTGDEDGAHAHLRSAFGIASANDYEGLIAYSRTLSARMCSEALARGIEPEYVRKLIRRHQFAPRSPDTENWPWPVQVYALGRFDVLVDGKPLVFGRKKPTRPLALLKYLAAQGGREVPETQIADALWPEQDGDEALNTLAINLHRLRRLLGNADAIVRQDRRLELNPQRVWCDIAAFERRLECAASVTGEVEHNRLIGGARALYRGDFLAGDDSEPWMIPVRERLRARAERAAHLQSGSLPS